MRLAVFSNPKACSAQQALPLVCEALRHEGAQVLTPAEPGPFPGNVSDALIEACDVAIALGGDGTIIHVAKRAALLDKPVLGINGGHLGFMAGLEMGELSLLSRLLSGDYRVERRMMLEIGLKGRTYHALNEAVISRGALSRLIELKVQARGEPVSHYQADGVIVATPTGSTAYSLSAGGPVVDPALRCMLLTPVCPHALHSRSYLFPADTDLSVSAMTEEDTPVYLTVDAEDNVVVEDAAVTFRPAEKDACLIQLKPHSFYEILDQKLSRRR